MYRGPLTTTFRRLKILSLSSLTLTFALSPFFFILETTASVPVVGRLALAGIAMATSGVSTALVAWCGRPYVTTLRFLTPAGAQAAVVVVTTRRRTPPPRCTDTTWRRTTRLVTCCRFTETGWLGRSATCTAPPPISAPPHAHKDKERRKAKITPEQKQKLHELEQERRRNMEERVETLTKKLVDRLRPFVHAKHPGSKDDPETQAFEQHVWLEADDMKLESFGVEVCRPCKSPPQPV